MGSGFWGLLGESFSYSGIIKGDCPCFLHFCDNSKIDLFSVILGDKQPLRKVVILNNLSSALLGFGLAKFDFHTVFEPVV